MQSGNALDNLREGIMEKKEGESTKQQEVKTLIKSIDCDTTEDTNQIESPQIQSTATTVVIGDAPPDAIKVGAQSPLALLMARTGYSIVQQNGQRRYGPPPNWTGSPPKRGCEVFVGKIPRDCFEDELIPVFEKAGKIYEMRLMMDYTGQNRGYAFVVYCNSADAKESVKQLNNYELRQGRTLGVCMSVDNCRLFIGGIPKRVSKDDIRAEMEKVTDGVVDVIVYPSASDKTKNRGFAFVEYETHRAAAMARRRFMNGRIQLWNHQIAIDWAEPELEVDEDVMAQVRVLYVRNLMLSTTEQVISDVFSRFAPVERVKKIRDYAFVHFQSREGAIKAMEALNGSSFDGARIEVTLAKPVDKDSCKLSPISRTMRQQATTSATTAPAVPFGFVPIECPIMPPSLYPTTQTGFVPASGRYLPRNSMGAKVIPSPRNAKGKPRAFFPITFNPHMPATATAAATLYPSTSYFTPPTVPPTNIPQFIDTNNAKRNLEEGGYFDVVTSIDMSPIQPQGQAPSAHNTPPTNIKSFKSSIQILEDICLKNNWSPPIYSLYSISPTHDGQQLFQYKVFIQGLGTAYIPSKYSRTMEEAQCIAAEYSLIQIGYPLESLGYSPQRGGIPTLSPLPPETMPLHPHYSPHGYFTSSKHVPPPSSTLPPPPPAAGWSPEAVPPPPIFTTGYDPAMASFHGPAHFPPPPPQELFHRVY